MSNEYIIDARGLSKCFKLYNRPGDRFFEWLSLGRKKLHDAFWALRDVDVQLRHGEKLGVIGANGSGKSTLLKILAGSLAPTSGLVNMHGRVFALIELSTGFNQDLTGRENISFVGMMLGLDRDYIAQRKEQIIAFADIGDFIDRPVRFYSSGMFVRLAFSLFAFLEPDLLIIDEAFAVGDAEFKEKSYKLMRSLVRAEGRSVLFVSHSMSTIEGVCDRVIWLDHGRCMMDAEPRRVIEAYKDHVRERKHERLERELAAGLEGDEKAPIELPKIVVPPEAKQLKITRRSQPSDPEMKAIWLEEKDGTVVQRMGAHRKFAIGFAMQFDEVCEPVFGLRIIGVDGAAITAADTSNDEASHVVRSGEECAVHWPIARGLPPGEYDVVCWCGPKASAPSASEVSSGNGRVPSTSDLSCAAARLVVEGPPRVAAALNLVMRPTVGRATHDR